MYPNEDVSGYINKHFVPAQVELGSNPPLENRCGVSWTPTLLFLGDAKELHYMKEGASFSVDNFLPLLKLGRAHAIIDNGNASKGLRVLDDVLENHRGSHFVPEALYWSGVAKGQLDDIDGLKDRWGQIKTDYPDSEWADRVSFLD